MIVRFPVLPAGAAALLAAAAALAQPGVLTVPPPPAATPAAADSTDPVEALGRYLRVLAIFPKNLDALAGAGRASLAIGDANAAISFFARAQEIAPGDGRIKAGLASALVQMEQPKTALKLFDQAVALGVPEAEIASDRGLARDLRGDTRRAQADYALALRARPDDETTRRLAVSQAIGGERGAAMLTLDPLLRRQDRAAWRVRAFVMALTGDRDGAELAARNAMPLPQAQALMPFFARLASLRPGEKAAAVHLGQFPSDGRSPDNPDNSVLFARADNAVSPAPSPGPRSDVPLIPAGAPLGAAASANLSETLSRAPRRRPGSIDGAPAVASVPPPTALALRPVTAPPAPSVLTVPPRAAAPAAVAGAGFAVDPFAPSRVAAAVPLIAVPARTAAIPTLPAMAPPVVAPPAPPAPVGQVAMGGPAPPPAQIASVPVAIANADAEVVATPYGPALAGSPVAPVKLAAVEPVKQPAPPPPAPAPTPEPPKEKAPAKAKSPAQDSAPPARERQVRVNGNEKPADAAEAKPSAKDVKSAKAAAAKEKLAAKDKKDKEEKDAKAKETAAEKDKSSGGERYWVQVASGANKSDLGRAWEKTKTRAPKLLDGRAPYSSPWKASNRLLVGPFKTEEEAQGFVNTLGKVGMVGMQFTSRGKTRVERLSGN